ncbi:MAG: hypothetical protein U9R57_03175 [Thermodesulfobacteriota bacterium]|nr:hypothetical protein [Thermodesulfobacteriota bacterium]
MNHIAKTITRNIRRSDEFSHVKVLFTGHRGSGKTTELFRLQKELEANSFFTIYMDVETLLDLGSLNYLDVLVAIAQEIQGTLHKKEMPLPDELLNNISNWFAKRIIEDTEGLDYKSSIKTEVKGGAEIPFFAKLFATVTANI